MVRRTYWLSAIEALWCEKSIMWLSGVRRAGKTFLCQSLPDCEYLDCELPSTRRALDDPEQFLRDVGRAAWCWTRFTASPTRPSCSR